MLVGEGCHHGQEGVGYPGFFVEDVVTFVVGSAVGRSTVRDGLPSVCLFQCGFEVFLEEVELVFLVELVKVGFLVVDVDVGFFVVDGGSGVGSNTVRDGLPSVCLFQCGFEVFLEEVELVFLVELVKIGFLVVDVDVGFFVVDGGSGVGSNTVRDGLCRVCRL